MTKRRKALTLLLGVFLTGFVFGVLLGRSCSGRPGSDIVEGRGQDAVQLPADPGAAAGGDTDDAVAACADDAAAEGVPFDDVDGTGEPEKREIIYYRDRLPYARLFADLNDAHVAMARKVGLSSVPKTRAELGNMRGLVRIEDCEHYVVDDLTYSMPYLTRGAAEELGAIAEAFCDSLRAKDLLDYKLVVSSLLRTEEDVSRLRRSGNPNASDNSAHCYGTTELTKVLGEVLLERKAAGKCLVKYEKREHCFHITSCY